MILEPFHDFPIVLINSGPTHEIKTAMDSLVHEIVFASRDFSFRFSNLSIFDIIKHSFIDKVINFFDVRLNRSLSIAWHIDKSELDLQRLDLSDCRVVCYLLSPISDYRFVFKFFIQKAIYETTFTDLRSPQKDDIEFHRFLERSPSSFNQNSNLTTILTFFLFRR